MPPENDAVRFKEAAFTFLVADLELGLTLAEIASANGPTHTRNVQNARKAYDTVLRFEEKAQLSETARIEFDGRAAQLKSELEKLGEVF